jgi:hypothetical protein
MAVPSGSQFGIRFVEQSQFDTMVSARTLTPGFWYFINGDRLFHIAFTNNTYRTQGGVSVKELVDELLQHIEIDSDYLYQMITNEVLVNQDFVQSLANYLILDDSDNSLSWQIANYIMSNETVMESITNELKAILNSIVSSIVSINAPDGTVLAENEDGVLTLPAATNEQYGIVKGQDNTLPDSWHKVSADEDGTLSVNRTALEAKIDQKISQSGGGAGGTPLDKAVAAPDRSTIGTIENRDLVLQQATPEHFGVVKCRPNCACHRKPIALESMDEMLVAEVKSGRHLFYPMVFPKRLPPRTEMLGKLTFMANESGNYCCCCGRNIDDNGTAKDFNKDFSINAINSTVKDFNKEFSINATNSTKDYDKDFTINGVDPVKDFTKNFALSAKNKLTRYPIWFRFADPFTTPFYSGTVQIVLNGGNSPLTVYFLCPFNSTTPFAEEGHFDSNVADIHNRALCGQDVLEYTTINEAEPYESYTVDLDEDINTVSIICYRDFTDRIVPDLFVQGANSLWIGEYTLLSDGQDVNMSSTNVVGNSINIRTWRN